MSTRANIVTDILNLDDDDDVPDGLATQDISGRNINQIKLTAMLRMKFGVGAYDVHVSCNQASKTFSTNNCACR